MGEILHNFCLFMNENKDGENPCGLFKNILLKFG